MRKLFRFMLSLIMGAVVTVSGYDGEKTVVIDGNVYRNAFYPVYMWIDEISICETGVQVKGGTYYPVIADDYDLFQSDYESGKTGGELYCKSEQWDSAYAQYHDGENYSFMVRERLYDKDSVLVNLKWDCFDRLARDYYGIEKLNWQQNYVGKAETLELDSDACAEGSEFYIGAESQDHRFSSVTIQVFLYKGRLYYFLGQDLHFGAYTTCYYIPIDESIHAYFVGLLAPLLRT